MYNSTKDLLRREAKRLQDEVARRQRSVQLQRTTLAESEVKLKAFELALAETLADLGEPVEAETPPQPLGYALAT